MIRWILSLIFLFAWIGCTPTNQALTDLTGGEATGGKIKVPGDLGNQAFLFTPISYDFGNRAVNAAPLSKTITIKNISSFDVYVSSVTGPAAAFSLVSDDCPRAPINIAPNQSCSAVVTFAPTAGGSLNSSLIINYGPTTGDTTAYTSNMGLSGTGVGTLSFTGIDSVSDIYSTQLKLNWTHVAGALTYYVFRVNADGSQTLVANVTPPTATYIVSGLTASTSYRYWVRVTDAVGAFDANVNVVTTSTNTSPPAPDINNGLDYTFASLGAIALGSTLTENFDDSRTGVATDAGVTYSCYFDQVINSSVASSVNCSTLPGTVSFMTTSGALSWNTTSQGAIGFYEFKVLATDNTSGLTDAAIFTVNLRPTYSTTNLIGNYSAMFSSGVSDQSITTTWQDLTSTNIDGTLTNFSFGGATGWLGVGSYTTPYRLGFDGTNDYVDLNTLANTNNSLSFETWVQPTQIATTPSGVIMSNGDSSAKGLVLREAKGYRSRVEAFAGGTPYVDEVLADAPYSYLRMGDVTGAAIYDSGSGGSTWTITSLVGTEESSGLNGNDKAFKFNGTSNRIISDSQFNPNGWSGVSYEAWVKYNAIPYSTIFCHAVQNYVQGYFWLYYSGTGLVFQSANGATSNAPSYAWTPTLGVWYHIAVTLDFTTRDYKLYINGVNVQTVLGIASVVTNLSGTTPKISVGAYYTNGESWQNGFLDEFAAYDHVLTPTRITAHYNARNNVPTCVSKTIDASKWNHLAATFDHASQGLKLYTNSNNDCSVTSSAITLSTTSAQMSVGAKVPAVNSPTAGTFFKGEITDARVYNAAITASDVAINMASQMEQVDIPRSITGLNLWLKADAITGLNNGDPVTTWSDVSSAGRSATQAGAARPTYIANGINGKPVVRFDGTDDQMNISGTPTTWTVFVVAKQTATAAGIRHIITGNGGTFLAYLTSINGSSSTFSWYMDAPNWASYQTVQAVNINSAHIHTYRGRTALAEAWIDGTLGIANGGTFNAGYLRCLGNYSCADTRWFYGDIAEVIGYSTTLTDGEKNRVEGYLKAKYGL